MTSGAEQNLTGVWDGLYSYPYGKASVPFTATLIDSGSYLGGTVHEQVPEHGLAQFVSSLSGQRNGRSVAFRKTYDPGSHPAYATVDYSGTLSPDGTSIEGRWTIPHGGSGKFLMTRPRRQELEVTRKIAETV